MANDRDGRHCGRQIRAFPPAPPPSGPAGPPKSSRMRWSGASHRSKAGKARLKQARSRRRAASSTSRPTTASRIVPASDTGAMEMALWSLLGARGVDVLAWESFGLGWVTRRRQAAQAGRRPRARSALWRTARPGRQSISSATWSSPGTARPPACACRTATGSPRIAPGLTICDATSAAFAQPLAFDKLDVVTFSWQKVLGGEAQHGMLILSPRAVERLDDLQAGLAAAKDLPHDERRQADRRHLRRRDDQHALDALRRGLSRRARLGRIRSAGSTR